MKSKETRDTKRKENVLRTLTREKSEHSHSEMGGEPGAFRLGHILEKFNLIQKRLVSSCTYTCEKKTVTTFATV